MNITSRITSATFSACITKKEELPKDDLPIIALVGRSNVGKSSLINSLTGRKELARTSSTPGKTLTMNFYCINDAFYLVDLPGYGFAKASKATRNKIQLMMNDFFTSCNNLKGVVQIVDIRHKPSPLDLQMHKWLKEQHFNGFVVLTKIDKLSNQQVIKMRSTILKEIRGTYSMLYSSKDVIGRDEFLDAIEKILAGFEFKVIESKIKNSTVEDEISDADKTETSRENQNPKNEPVKDVQIKNLSEEKDEGSNKNNRVNSNKENIRSIKKELKEKRTFNDKRRKRIKSKRFD